MAAPVFCVDCGGPTADHPRTVDQARRCLACHKLWRGDPARRFWAKVNKDGPIPATRPGLGPCWLWTGGTSEKGYGYFRWPNGGGVSAHRYAYTIGVGPIPEGKEIDHLCRVRNCVRFTHLEAVTHHINTLRGEIGQHNRKRERTHCGKGHAFEGYNLIVQPNGWRVCRTCKNEAWNAMNRARRSRRPSAEVRNQST